MPTNFDVTETAVCCLIFLAVHVYLHVVVKPARQTGLLRQFSPGVTVVGSFGSLGSLGEKNVDAIKADQT